MSAHHFYTLLSQYNLKLQSKLAEFYVIDQHIVVHNCSVEEKYNLNRNDLKSDLRG